VTLNTMTGAVIVDPGTPAGTYYITYSICEILNPTNCDNALVTVLVGPPVIDAINDNGGPINGYTGGVGVPNVLTNDLLNGVAVIPAQVAITAVSDPADGVTLNTMTGEVTVAPGTPAGTYLITYKICEILNPMNCDNAVVTVDVTAAPILAVDDNGGPVNGYTGGVGVPNVLANDLLNGSAVNPAQVTLSAVTDPADGVTLNTMTGAVIVDPGTPAGTYYITYSICEILNPTNCDNALVTVLVGPPVIDAINDNGGPINGYTGGVGVPNVLTNDLLNGVAVIPAQVTITAVSDPADGVTLNTMTGAVTVDPGTPAGTYYITYSICEILNPTNCDNALVTVIVAPPVIDAINDNGGPINGYTGGVGVPDVLANDLLNGVAVNPAQVTLAVVTDPADGVTLNAMTRVVTVAPGTPAGTYYITYSICEILNPTNCDNALVTVVVIPPVINATNDNAGPVNGYAGQMDVLNVFVNDSLNGQPVIPMEVNLVETLTDPSGNLQLNPNGNVDVDPCTPTGTYMLSYQICEVLNPTNCDGAVVTIGVVNNTPPVITCPANITIQCNESTDPVINHSLGLASAVDVCDPNVMITYDDVTAQGACTPEYTISRTWKATNLFGNFITCTQTILIHDTTPPTFTAPSNTTITKSAACSYDSSVSITGDVTNEADNCTPSLDAVPSDVTLAGACQGQTIINRTWTLTDECGNLTTHTQVITAVDVTPPVLGALTPVELECSSNIPPPATTITQYLLLAGASAADNCSSLANLTITSTTGLLDGDDCGGIIERIYYVSDACGNSSSKTQVFNVSDNTAPVLTPGVLLGCYNTVAEAFAAAAAATGKSDNCTPTANLAVGVNITSAMGGCDSILTVTVTDICGNFSTVQYETMINCQAVRLKVFIEGAYNMTTNKLDSALNVLHTLPGQDAPPFYIDQPAGQPYTVAPWNYTGNLGNTYGDGMGMTPYPPDVVDWVLVMVRKNGILPANTIWTCAGWLHTNGEVSFPDACPYPALNVNDAYYILVQHRNHLGILSPSFVDIECGGAYIIWNFTTSDSYRPVFRFGQKQVEPGIWAMYAGNGEQLTSIQAISSPDRTLWKIWQGVFGYSPGDFILDGATNSTDETIWKINQNKTTGVVFY
jgi:hypothetical protein